MRKASSLFVIRRVTGESMLPSLHPGRIVVGIRPGMIRQGDIVIVSHEGLEKIKRVQQINGLKVYIVGDNPDASTDSRHFGWIRRDQVVARVVWPLA